MNSSRPTKFVPVKDSRIYSEHSSADMFEEGHGEKALLKPYAVITSPVLQTTIAHKMNVPNKED